MRTGSRTHPPYGPRRHGWSVSHPDCDRAYGTSPPSEPITCALLIFVPEPAEVVGLQKHAVPSIYSIGHPKRWPGPFPLQNGSLLAEGKKFCVERRTTDEEFAEDGAGGSMILCLPERVSEGDAKFQGFCRRWNKWEGQLIDIRDVPVSRKRGFSKKALSATLEGAGVGYVHLRDLGDPKPGRDAARRGDMQTFERIFRAHLEGREAQEALEQAVEITSGVRACLLCFERDHSGCHRAIVAAENGGSRSISDPSFRCTAWTCQGGRLRRLRKWTRLRVRVKLKLS